MKREFEIAFVGLKPGDHEFDYHIDDKFFLPYGQQDFSNCEADIKLHLEKHASFMLLKFDIDGKADVVCDRCGNDFTIQLWDEFNMLVKLVDDPDKMNEQEEDPDVYYISRNESHLHIADWIYEFVNLSIPMQKICEQGIGNPTCNQEALDKLNKMKDTTSTQGEGIWKGLQQFNDLN